MADTVSLNLEPCGELRDKPLVLRSQPVYTIRVTVVGRTDSSPTSNTLISPNGKVEGCITTCGGPIEFRNSAPGSYKAVGFDRARNLSASRVVEVVDSDVDVILTLSPDVELNRPDVELNGAARVEGAGKVDLPAEPQRVDVIRLAEFGGANL